MTLDEAMQKAVEAGQDAANNAAETGLEEYATLKMIDAALTAALSALEEAGWVVVPKTREFICKSCYLRAEEGKPENEFW